MFHRGGVHSWRRPKERPFDLVCEGGGVRGIGLVGALDVLEREGYEAQYRAGTSAGAIAATLHAAGYTARQLRHHRGRDSLQQLHGPELARSGTDSSDQD